MGSSKAKKEARKTLDKEAIVSKLAENFGRSDLTGETHFHDGPSFSKDAISQMGLTSVVPLVQRGSKKLVEHHHMWRLPRSLATANAWEEFEPYWKEQLQLPKPSTLRACLKAFGSQFLLAIGLVFVFAASQYALPLLMPYMVNWFIFNTILPTWWVYVYAVSIYAAMLCGSLFNYHAQLITYKFGLRVRAALITLIYRKSLNVVLSRSQSSGTVVNMIATDAQLLLETLPLFLQGILAPVQIAVTLGLLSRYLKAYTLISLGVAILAFPLTGFIASRFAAMRAKVQAKSDVRLKFVKEFLTAIRIVKYYAWERPFVKNINATRDDQLVTVKTLLYYRAILISVLTNIPSLGIGLTFTFYGIKNSMGFQSVFSAITYLNMLRIPFIFLPMLLAFVGQYFTSFDRMTFFALRSEIDHRPIDSDKDGIGGMQISNANFAWETPLSIAESRYFDLEKLEADITKQDGLTEDPKEKQECAEKLKAAQAEKAYMTKVVHNLRLTQQKASQISSQGSSNITDDAFETITEEEKAKYSALREPVTTLHDISLRVKPGKLTAIVGSVGSGKSTLANAFLGEVHATTGSVHVYAPFSYAAQEAWILNATIRDNITFGKEYDPEWYADVIRACALTTDLAMFPASDLTEIGERGTNLSGGQRQRINVARAMYSKSPVVIMDDPFSAVDSHVGEHMFAHVARRMAQDGRAVLLITNQLHFVPEVDYVAVLKKGRMVEQGAPSQLVKMEGGYLRKMLAKQTASNTSNVTVTDAERAESQDAREKMKATKDVKYMPTPEKDEEYRRKGALIKAEEREEGNIGFGTYWRYIKAGGLLLMLFVLISQALRTGFRVMGGIYLSWWSDPTNARKISNNNYIGGYIGFTLAEAASSVVGSLLFVQFAIRAGRYLHVGITRAVSRAPTGWFDVTPAGRIITRFSKDIDFIDIQLPQLVEQTINFGFILIGLIASIAVGTPYVLIIFAVAGIGFGALTLHYRKTSIQVQRLEALSRAPIFSHFNETLEGSATIRAYGMGPIFRVANMNKIDANTVDFLALRYCSAWFGLTLDMIGNLFVVASYIVMILVRTYAPNSIAVGYIIFAVSNTGGISSSLAAFSNAITDLENKMNSAERVLQYFVLPEEAPTEIPENRPEESWPAQGAIKIEDLVIEYKAGVPVLKNLSCQIKPREKIGIVGRTGAGKSTLITALFRTVEPTQGSIHIDDVDISNIGLFDLRSRLSIIPQMPQLFVGTVRYNLDPFDEHTDDELWKVLKMVKLKNEVSKLDGKLLAPVEENGSNFSVGQRQLLSMARCLLRNTHVLLLDEATAAVDVETDALLQSMIRKNFRDKTVLTIAHRLNTIMDSDRIMVLDAGQIIEFDSPKKLLSKKGGVLSGMVEATGPDSAAYLRSIALGQVSVAESIVALTKSSELAKSNELFRSGELMRSLEIKRSSEVPRQDSTSSDDVVEIPVAAPSKKPKRKKQAEAPQDSDNE
jgi:ABC-type multidrug transport system fused ATPase/permease subunit